MKAKEKKISRMLDLFESGQYSEASKIAQGLIDNFPEDVMGWKALGAICNQEGNYGKAIDAMEKAIIIAPEDPELHANLGAAYLGKGDAESAEISYRKAILLAPEFAQAYSNLGVALKNKGDYSGAEQAFRTALEMHPHDPQAWTRLAVLLMQHGRQEDAEVYLSAALELDPNNVEAMAVLANLLAVQKRFFEAEEIYARIENMGSETAESLINRANLLFELGDYSSAEKKYRQAMLADPLNTKIYIGLASSLNESGRYEEAEINCRIALSIESENITAMRNLSVPLMATGRYKEAEEVLQHALALEGGAQDPDILNNLGMAYKSQGRLKEALSMFAEAVDIYPAGLHLHGNLLFMMSHDESISALETRKAAERFAAASRQLVDSPYTTWNTSNDNRSLRIGFVSGDLHSHPVGYFIENLLIGLEGVEGLELFAYPTTKIEDELSLRIKPHFKSWVSIKGLSDRDAAALIHDHGINVLIDLSGHTAKNRLSVFSWKPAPVQASWMGYFATTGMQEIDYFIGDDYVFPEDESAHFIESPLRLPGGYIGMSAPVFAPEVSDLPALKNGFITFGCFNNLAKVNDTVIQLWSKILSAVPGSRLLLKTQQLDDATTRQEILQRFIACGVAESCLMLEGGVPRSQLLACYGRIDIALDPFPYPGGVTSAEALWMGVPVLTKKGDRFLSHVGESVVGNAGLHEWIAADPADYLQKAVAFSSDLERLSRLRSGLRAAVKNSPLFDAQRYAQEFKAAMQDIWAKWQSTHGAVK